MRARRRGITAAIAATGLVTAVLLAGCSASPVDARDRAEAVFDALVAEATAFDAQALRTIEVEPPAEQACGDDASVTSVGYSATATLPVTATALVLDQVADDLVDSLDPLLWLPIEPSAGLDQRAVEHADDGTVATVTIADRLLVIAVFTPCQVFD